VVGTTPRATLQFSTEFRISPSLFKAATCKVTLSKLLERYNEIVEACETDPSLKIKLSSPSISE
jgi:hypothetical protein